MTIKRPLTPRARQFVREYLIDLDATNAARRAGYSMRTAKQTGFDLLQDPRVRSMVDAEIAARAKRTQLTADGVLESLQRLSLKAEADGDYGPAIRAQEHLGRHLKLFTDRVEIKDTTPRAERLHAARMRRDQATKT